MQVSSRKIGGVCYIETPGLQTASSMTRQLLVFLCVVTFVLAAGRHASAQTDKDFAIWAALFATGQVFEDQPSPVFWLDVHARRGDSGTVGILRPGVGYAFAPWVSLWVGYAWVPEWFDATGQRIDEQRVWEQLIFDYRSKLGLWFQSRSRFEQRFSNAGSGTAHRFRQLVRLNYRPKESVPVGIAFLDEVFVGIQGASWAKQGFDQNRVFLGLAIYAFEKRFRVEVGYLNDYLSRQPNRLVHILSINFFLSFKGKKNASSGGELGS
jgi:hypothetical protein